jgi:putative endonuclease
MPFYTYILESEQGGRYYIGCTSDLEDRLARHNRGRSKYTRNRGPWRYVHVEEYETLSEARRRESAIKARRSRGFIEELVSASRL